MNKTELVDELASVTDVAKKDVKAVVDALFDVDGVIAGALKGGDRVALTGFGTFEVRSRAARTARNPRTGEEIQVPASKAPAFRAGKSLKDAIR